MSYNEKLADRIRELIAAKEKKVEEKRMFSGMCFMVNDKMCVCLGKGTIMVRLDPNISEQMLEKEGVSPMVMSGKIIKGFVRVDEDTLTTQKKLAYWVDLALSFNKFAKSSKEKSSDKKPSSKKVAKPKVPSPKKRSL